MRYLFFLLMMQFLTGLAYAEEKTVQIQIEWNKVDEAWIQKCAFKDLYTRLSERVLQDGFAVVKQLDQNSLGIVLELSTTAFEFRILAEAQGERTTNEHTLVVLPISQNHPQKCDGIFKSRILDEAAQAANQLRSHLKKQDSLNNESQNLETQQINHKTETFAEPSKKHTPELSTQNQFGRFYLSGLLLWPKASNVMFGGRAHLWFNKYLGMVVDASFYTSQILIFEPSVGLSFRVFGDQLFHTPALSFLFIGFEGAALVHSYFPDNDDSGAHLDARFALPIGFQLGFQHSMGLFAAIAPYVRAKKVEHVSQSKLLFEANHFGVLFETGIFF